MTDFLVKCFVKDHDKTEDPQETRNLLFENGYIHEGRRLFELLLEHMAAPSDPFICDPGAYEAFLHILS